MLECFGNLHCLGVDINMEPILGHEQTGVPTDFLESSVDWDHSQSWAVPSWNEYVAAASSGNPTEACFKLGIALPMFFENDFKQGNVEQNAAQCNFTQIWLKLIL